jgi:hypothetical protein
MARSLSRILVRNLKPAGSCFSRVSGFGRSRILVRRKLSEFQGIVQKKRLLKSEGRKALRQTSPLFAQCCIGGGSGLVFSNTCKASSCLPRAPNNVPPSSYCMFYFEVQYSVPHIKEGFLDGILETISSSQFNQSLLLHVAHRQGIHSNKHHLHILILCFLYHLFKDAS